MPCKGGVEWCWHWIASLWSPTIPQQLTNALAITDCAKASHSLHYTSLELPCQEFITLLLLLLLHVSFPLQSRNRKAVRGFEVAGVLSMKIQMLSHSFAPFRFGIEEMHGNHEHYLKFPEPSLSHRRGYSWIQISV